MSKERYCYRCEKLVNDKNGKIIITNFELESFKNNRLIRVCKECIHVYKKVDPPEGEENCSSKTK